MGVQSAERLAKSIRRLTFAVKSILQEYFLPFSLLFIVPPCIPVVYLFLTSFYYGVTFTAAEWTAWIAFFVVAWAVWVLLVRELIDYGIRKFGRLSKDRLEKEDVVIGSIIYPLSFIVLFIARVFLGGLPQYIWEIEFLTAFASPVLAGIGYFRKSPLFRLYSRFVYMTWLMGVLLSFVNAQFFPVTLAAKRTPLMVMLAYIGLMSFGAAYYFSRSVLALRYGFDGIDVLLNRYPINGMDATDEEALLADLKQRNVDLEEIRNWYGLLRLIIWSRYVDALYVIEDWILNRAHKTIKITILKPSFPIPVEQIRFGTEFYSADLVNLYLELRLSGKNLLLHVLRTDIEKKVYELSDGRSADEIAGDVGVSKETVLNLWSRWSKIPVVKKYRIGGPYCKFKGSPQLS